MFVVFSIIQCLMIILAKTGKHLHLTDMIQSSRDALREYIGPSDLSELLIYDFDTISTSTNNFNISNKLGQGGFGPVYKVIFFCSFSFSLWTTGPRYRHECND